MTAVDERRLSSAAVDVGAQDRDEDKDEDKDKDEDEDKDKDEDKDEDKASMRSAPERAPYEEIKRLFNSVCVSFPRITAMSETRKKAVASRWRESGESLDVMREVFARAEGSDFLTGRSGGDWRASFDWLIKASNWQKVLEGNYDNAPGGGNSAPQNCDSTLYGSVFTVV